MFIITAEPIPDGKVGRGFISGVVPAWIDVQDTNDNYAEINDGDSNALKSGASGSAFHPLAGGQRHRRAMGHCAVGRSRAATHAGVVGLGRRHGGREASGHRRQPVGDTDSTITTLSTDACGTKIYQGDLFLTVEAADGTRLAIPVFGTSDQATNWTAALTTKPTTTIGTLPTRTGRALSSRRSAWLGAARPATRFTSTPGR